MTRSERDTERRERESPHAPEEDVAGGTEGEDPDGPAAESDHAGEAETAGEGRSAPDGRVEAEEELESELERLRAEVSELNDRHLRLAAEFDNYRRRSRTELDESRARAQADLVGEFLEVLDDLERVQDVDPESTSVDALLEGIEMVGRKFGKVLDGAGVEAIDPAGEAFDPEWMEAMTTVPTDSEDDDEMVHEVFQKGYRLDGQLIRPARVSVRKNA